jgi:hypothetical protein
VKKNQQRHFVGFGQCNAFTHQTSPIAIRKRASERKSTLTISRRDVDDTNDDVVVDVVVDVVDDVDDDIASLNCKQCFALWLLA